ncbi:MAG: nitronate monooxygenase [Chloroflexi bacterium]|nr:nitronate monooxygenase [Chloroflexota bacterium]
MFKTWLTETLGIKYPIIQGAMLWLSRAELAAAVSNAGGLGIIAAASFHTAAEFREEIRRAKALTGRPFAVNFTLMPTRRRISWEEYIAAALEEGVKVIETSGRSPEPYIGWLKEAGVTVMHKVARVRDARTAERLGVDAVTITGFEAGGHPGMEDVTSLALIPRAVDSVRIPVIAAGGFADGRGLAAALALGAQGVLMGTRFMASQECPLHPAIKELMLRSSETDTVLVERSIKNAARVLKTGFALRVLEMEQNGATLDELFPLISGARIKRAYESGAVDDAVLYCGQAVGQITDIPTVKEIIDRTVHEAGEAARRLCRP